MIFATLYNDDFSEFITILQNDKKALTFGITKQKSKKKNQKSEGHL
jgi:hypothetical protein